MLILISLLFIFTNKISKMILCSIILVMYLSMNLYSKSLNSWMSMSMFLALVGGLLVLFSLVFSNFLNSMDKLSNFPIFLFFLFPFSLITNFFQMEMIHPWIISFNVFVMFFLLFILNFSLVIISKMIFFSEKSFRSFIS